MKRCIVSIVLSLLSVAVFSCELQDFMKVEQRGEPCVGSVNAFGYCNVYEYCSSEKKCVKAGDYCASATKNHNGFGYCIGGYACTLGECVEGEFVCKSKKDCSEPLTCRNELCVCGEQGGVCGEKQRCCLGGGGYCITFDDQSQMLDCDACQPGYANCNDDWSDGCEVNIWGTDARNCGGCGVSCEEGSICRNGGCGTSLCHGDELTCLYEGLSYCISKTLLPLIGLEDCETCEAGFGNCNGDWRDGCEENVFDSPLHCGSCDNVCAQGSPCRNGYCVPLCMGNQLLCGTDAKMECVDLGLGNLENCDTCKVGFLNCNGVLSDGCEISKTNHQMESCGACAAGFANCDGDWSNGCEVNLSATNRSNCTSCLAGYENCDGNWVNGCEAHLATTHRSACTICLPGRGNCDGNWINGCEVNLLGSDSNNCGVCGRVCNDGNACTVGDRCSSGTCVSGTLKTCTPPNACYTSSCNRSTGACVNSYRGDGYRWGNEAQRCCNGAPVNISTDSKNCGGCGQVCASSMYCEPAHTSNCAPVNVSGRCKCYRANAQCPDGQICRLEQYPFSNRCTPPGNANCAPGQVLANSNPGQCPNYCKY